MWRFNIIYSDPFWSRSRSLISSVWISHNRAIGSVVLWVILISARNEVGARLCFYRCLWFCSQAGSTWHPPPPSRHPPDQVHPRSRHPPGPGTPRADTPPRLGTPPKQTPPGTRYTPQTKYTPPELSTPPPPGEHAVRYGQRAGGTQPTGMQSCILLHLLLIRTLQFYKLLHFRGSNAYKEFRTALQKEGAYTWLVEALDKTDTSSATSSSTCSAGPIKGLWF